MSGSLASDAEWPAPEAIHLPFESGPYRMAMGLTTVPESAWFEIDACYADEMAERRRLLAERHDDVFGALPVVRGCAHARCCGVSWRI